MAIRQFKTTPGITDRGSLSVNNYLRELNRYPVLSVEEEVELTRKIRKGGKEGEKAKKRLIECNLRFVVSVANQYHQKSMELSDLISEGNIGLIKAAERFDETRGFKFISFAVWWIRQSIMASISEHGRIVRIPLNQQALIQQYKMLAHETMQTEQRKPTSEEFAAFADIDVDKAQLVIQSISRSVSTDSPVSDDNDATIGDMLVSESMTDGITEHESLHTDLISIIDKSLNQREKEIVIRSFGINNREESLEDISEEFGLSRERVRQIREKAVMKIKESDNCHLLFKYLG